ncbi:MAG: hypothetical protein IKQ87_11185 [Clostridia bacterium]|nr:hypothetical protein [Clostridia bacterium]
MPAARSGISTYQTYLMIGTTSGSTTTYQTLIDIVSFPDLGDEPETIDTTTLTDNMMTFIPGIQSNGNMTFEANYTPENYTAVKEYDDGEAHPVAIWFGAADYDDPTSSPDGHDGKFSFTGFIKPILGGGGVNEKVTMSIVVTPNSVIDFDVTSSGVTYSYTEVSSPAAGANPKMSGWYTRSGESGSYVYTKTTDTTVQNGATYYTRTAIVS